VELELELELEPDDGGSVDFFFFAVVVDVNADVAGDASVVGAVSVFSVGAVGMGVVSFFKMLLLHGATDSCVLLSFCALWFSDLLLVDAAVDLVSCIDACRR